MKRSLLNLKIVFIFFFWRLLIFLPLVLGYYFIHYRDGVDYTNIWSRVVSYFPVDSFLLFPWANFDGVHYLSIAGNGYTFDGRFFPLFPLIIRYLSELLGGSKAFELINFFSGLLVVNIAFLLSLVFLYRLIRLDYSEKVARWAIIILLLFPTSFYFISIYSEGLFLLLTVLSFYFARQRKWLLVGVCGGLLSVTRLVGICILPALIIEFFIQEKIIRFWSIGLIKDKILKILPLFLVPLGLISFMLYNLQKWGDTFYFIQAQAMLDNGRSVNSFILFPQTIFRYLKILFSLPTTQYEWWIALLELIIFFATSVLLYIAWKKKIRMSYLIFSILSFLVPIFSGTFSGLPRYVIVLFPIYVVLALASRRVKIIYFLISPIILVILLMLFSRGYFVA